jgi:hypothetical protein
MVAVMAKRDSHQNLAPEAWIPDSWIIEELEREERERDERRRPYLEIPAPEPGTWEPPQREDSHDRGVVIIEL